MPRNSLIRVVAGISAAILFFLDTLIYFFAMNRNILWGIDADSYLIAFYTEDGDCYIIAYHQSLTNPAS
tara:strand:+ start:19207 stop:19413 length:207 start_codon:yes stop_codon:yes gene_type:complete